jgi:hypothetical protein
VVEFIRAAALNRNRLPWSKEARHPQKQSYEKDIPDLLCNGFLLLEFFRPDEFSANPSPYVYVFSGEGTLAELRV